MGRRAKLIDPDHQPEEQLRLFEEAAPTGAFPPIYRNISGLIKVVEGAREGIGLDLEYSHNRPTILGVANDRECAAIPWENEQARAVVQHALNTRQPLVAYSGSGADRPVLEEALGVCLPLEHWEDPMLAHYLTHMELCVRGDTRIVLADGSTKSIENIVANNWKGLVRTIGPTGEILTRPITGWHRSPRGSRKFLNLGYKYNSIGHKTAAITEDHLVLTKRGYVPISNLEEGDLLASGTPGLVQGTREFSALAGMVLGDSYLEKRGVFSIFNGDKQKTYVERKQRLLCGVHEPTFLGKWSHYREMNRWVSRAYPFFRWLFDYRESGKLVDHAVDLYSVLIWLLDDGTLADGINEISVTSYSDEQGEHLASCVQRATGINCWFRRSPSGRAVVTFGRDGTRKLWEKIAHLVPPEMRYKVAPDRTVEFYNWFLPEKPNQVFWSQPVVTPIQPRNNNGYEGDNSVYCIDVQETHNFITYGGAVHNCKAPGKSEDEDDAGALGLMNLWTAAAFATDLPQWKECRGYRCTSTKPHPCPTHDVFGYCAVDAWAGLQVHRVCQKELKERGTPYELYRQLMSLSEMCEAMQRQGVLVDMEHIKKLEGSADARKEFLFPLVELEGGGEGYSPFNPKSPKQVTEWFASKGINLKGTDRKIIRGELRKAARKAGYGDGEELEKVEEPLPEVLDVLYRLNQFKEAGKGLKSWFDSRWMGKDGLVHPRFIVTGTSTGRLASSKPNFQNVPARGFGAEVRRAVVARPGYKLLKADKCVGPTTKLLTSDLKWVAADTVKLGDELFGFDEKLCGHKNKFRRTRVTGVSSVYKPSCKLLFSSGRQVTCSDDHMWVVLRKKSSGGGLVRTWVETKDLKVDDRFPVVVDPWEEDTSWDSGFVSGIFSGEGWFYNGAIGFGQNEGEVLDTTLAILQKKGYTNFYHDARKYKDAVYHRYNISNRRGAVLSFLGRFRPPRLFNRHYESWENRRSWGKLTEADTLISISPVGLQKLCAIETETHTFVAEGYMSHNCQLELRICLWLAGVDLKDVAGDAFSWLVNKSGTAFDEAAARYHMTAREVAKSVSHGGDYLEGIEILRSQDFDARRLEEIRTGALRVYMKKYMPGLKRDWEYGGGVVAFTGANLAERLFGNKTVEARRRALEIQEDVYFRNFPMLREWQMGVLEEVERTGGVRLETGRWVRLADITMESAKENAKIGAATKGQGNGAEHIISAMLSYWKEGVVPILQVHDELVFEVPVEWGEEKMREFLEPMMVEDWRLKGFVCPIKAKVGLNWLDMKPV